MKGTTKRLWTVIGQDIVLSWQDARWGLGIGALLFIAAAMQHQASLGSAADVQIVPTLSDYIMFAFAGSHPFIHGSGAPFILPITWFALVFFCVHSCALFPHRMMRRMGKNRLIQSGSRLRWWSRLTFLVILWSIAYALLGLLCMTAMGVIRYGVCQMGTVQIDLICTVFLTLCVLSELQAVCSALTSPLVGELANTALMICAAFGDHPALWPRYSMFLRSSAFEADGFPAIVASIYLMFSFLVIFALGALLFQRSSILSHDKGR